MGAERYVSAEMLVACDSSATVTGRYHELVGPGGDGEGADVGLGRDHLRGGGRPLALLVLEVADGPGEVEVPIHSPGVIYEAPHCFDTRQLALQTTRNGCSLRMYGMGRGQPGEHLFPPRPPALRSQRRCSHSPCPAVSKRA